jgi:hypothetical protein
MDLSVKRHLYQPIPHHHHLHLTTKHLTPSANHHHHHLHIAAAGHPSLRSLSQPTCRHHHLTKVSLQPPLRDLLLLVRCIHYVRYPSKVIIPHSHLPPVLLPSSCGVHHNRYPRTNRRALWQRHPHHQTIFMYLIEKGVLLVWKSRDGYRL